MKPGQKIASMFSRCLCLCVACFAIFRGDPEVVLGELVDSNFYYYSSGRKVPLSLSTRLLAVRFKPGVTLENQAATIKAQHYLQPFSNRQETSLPNATLFPFIEGCSKANAIKAVNTLNKMDSVQTACPVFDLGYGDLILTDEFIVKFDRSVSKAEIDAFNSLNNVEIARKGKWTERYTLRVKDSADMNTLRTANLYHEAPITEFSMPNFVIRSERLLGAVAPDDTYFAQQWCLRNTGQDPPDGKDNADINAPEGWETSTGSPDIVIAIIDTGVDLTHEDLENVLVDGYATGGLLPLMMMGQRILPLYRPLLTILMTAIRFWSWMGPIGARVIAILTFTARLSPSNQRTGRKTALLTVTAPHPSRIGGSIFIPAKAQTRCSQV